MDLRTDAEKNTSMVPVDNIRKSQENNHVENASIASTSSSAEFASKKNIPHYTNMASDLTMHYPNQRLSYPNLRYNPLSSVRGLINLPITPYRYTLPYSPVSIQRPILNTNPYFVNRFRHSPSNDTVLMNTSHSGNSNVCNVSNAFSTNQNVQDLPNNIHKRVESMDFQQTTGSTQTGTLTAAATMDRSRLEAYEIERVNGNINHDSRENGHSKDLAYPNRTINYQNDNLFANIENNYNKILGKTNENHIKSLTIHAFHTMAIKIVKIHPLFQLPDETVTVSESQPKSMENICHEVHKQIYSAIEQKKLNGGLIFDFSYLSNASEIHCDSTNSSNRKLNKFVASATYYPPAYVPYNSSTPTYQCCVCMHFSSNSVCTLLGHMSMHVLPDKCLSGMYNHNWATFKDNIFTCVPCNFKTNKKQAFKTHEKAKKHAFYLSEFCRIQSVVTASEWLSRNNEIRTIAQCHACNFEARSFWEIHDHSKEIDHLINERLYRMLSEEDFNSAEQPVKYKCKLCRETVATKNELLRHLKAKHAFQSKHANRRGPPKSDFEFIEIIKLQKEGFSSRNTNSESKEIGAFNGNIETGTENHPTDKCDEKQNNSPPQCVNRKYSTVLENPLIQQILIGRTLSLELPTIFHCPFCNFENVSELLVRMHVLKHSRLMSKLNCPLCILGFNDDESLRIHASNFHHVTEGNLNQVILAGLKQRISSENLVRAEHQFDNPMYPNFAKLRFLLKQSQLPMLQIESAKQNNENSLERTSLEKCNADARQLSNQEQCNGTKNDYSIYKICGKLPEDVPQYEDISDEEICVSSPQSASEKSCFNDTNQVQQN